MNIGNSKTAKYVDLQDGRTVLDLYELAEDTALFSYVMDNPRHREMLENLVDSKDTAGLYKWIDSLDKNVLSNGAQKSYLVDVFRDCVFQKFPQEKQKYQELKQKIEDSPTHIEKKTGADLEPML